MGIEKTPAHERMTFFRGLYSMKITEQTRKLAAGCSKHRFEVADKADVV